MKELVLLHGGSIKAASEGEACGSTFTVQLPLWTRSAVTPEVEPERAEPVSLKRFSILVVDDEPDARRIRAGSFD